MWHSCTLNTLSKHNIQHTDVILKKLHVCVSNFPPNHELKSCSFTNTQKLTMNLLRLFLYFYLWVPLHAFNFPPPRLIFWEYPCLAQRCMHYKFFESTKKSKDGQWCLGNCAKKWNFHFNALKICQFICFKLVIVFIMFFFFFWFSFSIFWLVKCWCVIFVFNLVKHATNKENMIMV